MAIYSIECDGPAYWIVEHRKGSALSRRERCDTLVAALDRLQALEEMAKTIQQQDAMFDPPGPHWSANVPGRRTNPAN